MEATFRAATLDDASILTEMVRDMVTDMASYGGHAAATDDASWKRLSETFKEQMGEAHYRYIIAEDLQHSIIGCGGAEVRMLGGAHIPKKMLHISVAYVKPDFRGNGIGKSLLKDLMSWGRETGCVEAELNVVEMNPALSLYQKLGFKGFQRSLVCQL